MQTSYHPKADSGLYGFCVQTETMTVTRSLRDILFILELPFFNLNRSRFLSVVGVSFRQYIPVHLQHKILDRLWWGKQNNRNDYFALPTTMYDYFALPTTIDPICCAAGELGYTDGRIPPPHSGTANDSG